jgi:hypothetical protein
LHVHVSLHSECINSPSIEGLGAPRLTCYVYRLVVIHDEPRFVMLINLVCQNDEYISQYDKLTVVISGDEASDEPNICNFDEVKFFSVSEWCI